jgi:hypothetical protein
MSYSDIEDTKLMVAITDGVAGLVGDDAALICSM